MKGEINAQLNYNKCGGDKRRRIILLKRDVLLILSHELSKLSTIELTFRNFELSFSLSNRWILLKIIIKIFLLLIRCVWLIKKINSFETYLIHACISFQIGIGFAGDLTLVILVLAVSILLCNHLYTQFSHIYSHTLLVFCLIVDKSYKLVPFTRLVFVGAAQIFRNEQTYIEQEKYAINQTNFRWFVSERRFFSKFTLSN